MSGAEDVRARIIFTWLSKYSTSNIVLLNWNKNLQFIEPKPKLLYTVFFYGVVGSKRQMDTSESERKMLTEVQ